MIRIVCLFENPTVQLAARELDRYLTAMGYQGEWELQLGSYAEFGLEAVGTDPTLDDEFAIEFHGGRGYIAGSNPRSILFGAYRFLEVCGARWVRPGKDGNYLQQISCLPENISIKTEAKKRFRAICIEGTVGVEHVLDLIEWMPKVGFNGYYTQFRDGFIFFDRWYSHRGSPVKKPEPFSVETSYEYVARIQAATKERGLMLHAVGHGWTCEPFGVANHGWDEVKAEDIPDSYREVCALVDGKRDVWMGMPLATQLCYSRPDVQTAMVESVVDYLKQNPMTDILHFWLGDYFNNTCECEECRKYPPADYYVRILNQLDARLMEEKIDARVVFLIYYDLLPPPIKERLENPDRFILMFAPITRNYKESFPHGFAVKEAPAYKLNKLDLPSSVDENLAYLWQWEQLFSGDTFVFDYHLMWDHLFDAGGEKISRVLYDDIRNYDSLGLGGLVSCQLQRNAFPTSLAMTTMGRTLWDTDVDFDTLRRDLYAATYGKEHAEAVGKYLATLSRCFDTGAIRFKMPLPEGQLEILLREAVAAIDTFVPTIKANRNACDPCHKKSWELLDIHARIYKNVALSLLAKLEKQEEKAKQIMDEACRIAWKEEDSLSDVLDCHFFDDVMHKRPQL
ncbi:MAG: DUF4838 domain-containing protein [Clostridia bacterium]|nr:DUF4838 domain-containing protein [Clostridia bacterium]